MKKLLNAAQDFMDRNKEIPESILQKMDDDDTASLQKMITFKENLKDAFDREISTAPIYFNPASVREKKTASAGPAHFSRFYFLLSTAAVLSIAVGLPLSHSLKSRKLIREETRSFVTTITDSTSWMENTLDDTTISPNWFSTEPLGISSN